MERRRFIGTIIAGSTVLVAGCSDGGGTDTTTTTTEETTTEETTTTTTEETTTEETTTTTTEETTTTTTEETTTTEAADMTVAVAPDGRLRFDPDEFTVDTGATVRWVWEGSGHNVVVEDQPDDADWPGDDDQLYSEGHTHTYTFEVSGEYDYYCRPHQSSGMEGSFTVE